MEEKIITAMQHIRWFAGMNMSRGIVLSSVQFDFSYSSAIITRNSAFILGLSDPKSNPIKDTCDL